MSSDIKSEVNVIMFGPRRCGKTSILAAMTQTFDKIKNTDLVLNTEYGDDVLDEALSSMKNIFRKNDQAFFTNNDLEATDVIREYYFNLSTVESNAKKKSKHTKHTIRFSDIPGEFINPPRTSDISLQDREERRKIVGEKLAESDVIFIAIDTVMMMEEDGKYNEKCNCCGEISKFLKANLINADEKKMIIFVPLKYETYYYSGMGAKVNDMVKIYYDSLINYLTKDTFKNTFYVAITPVLTLGDVIYGGSIDDDGGIIKASFKFRCKNATFNPEYCDQPLIHILKYIEHLIKYNKSGKIRNMWFEKFLNEKFNFKNDFYFMREIEKLKYSGGNCYLIIQDIFS